MTFCTRHYGTRHNSLWSCSLWHKEQFTMSQGTMTMASVRPSSSHNMQAIENLSKRENKTDTRFSYEIWKLKEQNKNLSILWGIVGIH